MFYQVCVYLSGCKYTYNIYIYTVIVICVCFPIVSSVIFFMGIKKHSSIQELTGS